MIRIKIMLSLVLCLLVAQYEVMASTNTPEAATITITGHVEEKVTGDPLFGVNITLKGTQRGTQTNESGAFEFINMKPGTYIIKAQYLGFSSQEKTITIDGKKSSVHLHFLLEESALMGDEVVVSASRNEVSRIEAPVVVNVISAKMFETVNSCDLSQSLSYQSGVRVENNCQNCGFPQVRINGLEGPYSQILINSRAVMSSLSGVYGLEQIPVNMIERVEVVKGGGSALFGSNAVAGTINIITKEPLFNSYSVSSNLSLIDKHSMQQTLNSNVALVGKEGKSGIALYQSYRNRDSYDRDGDGFSEIGTLKSHTFGFSNYIKPTDHSKLTLDFHTTNEFRRGGSQFDLQPHETDITEQTQHYINSGGLTYDIFLSDFKHKLSFYTSAQHIGRDSYYGSHQDSSAYGHTKDLTLLGGAQMVSEYDHLLFAPATLTYGAEYQYNDMKDVMKGYNRTLHQNVQIGGGYFQSEWKINKLNFLAGLRLDKHNLIDRLIVSPRLNLMYAFSEKMQARLTYSSGFRAPQAFDEDLHVTQVGGEAMVIQLANNLKEERSNSLSSSIDFYHRWGEVDINLLVEGFYTDLKNAFVLESMGVDANNGTLIMERRNGSGAQVVGMNLDGKLAWGHRREYQLQAGYTLSKSEYKKAEQWSNDLSVAPIKQMTRTPRNYGYFTFTYNPIKPLNAMLSGTYTGKMRVPHFAGYIAQDRMETTPNFCDMNFKVTYDFAILKDYKMQLNGGVQNLFNAFQKDLDKGIDRDSGYFYGPTQPRTFFIGLKITN